MTIVAALLLITNYY